MTGIMKLFQQWDALYQNGYQTEIDDDALGAVCRQMKAIEQDMAAQPATDAKDFAAKVIALTTFGAYGLPDEDAARLFADARKVLS